MKYNKNLVGGSTDLLILSLISEKDMYGYEIINILEKRSNNTFNFKEGTLYPILHRLENKGYLKSYKEKSDAGRSRKYYKITKKGLNQLEKEKEEWASFQKTINTIISGEINVSI